MSAALYNILFHVVLGTKGARDLIHPRWEEFLHQTLRGCVEKAGAAPIAIGGASDHVHLLLGLRPTDTPDTIVTQIKTVSAAWAKHHDPNFDWQDEYALFSVSHVVHGKVEHFIRGQTAHHRQVKFAGEMGWLLTKNAAGTKPRCVH